MLLLSNGGMGNKDSLLGDRKELEIGMDVIGDVEEIVFPGKLLNTVYDKVQTKETCPRDNWYIFVKKKWMLPFSSVVI